MFLLDKIIPNNFHEESVGLAILLPPEGTRKFGERIRAESQGYGGWVHVSQEDGGGWMLLLGCNRLVGQVGKCRVKFFGPVGLVEIGQKYGYFGSDRYGRKCTVRLTPVGNMETSRGAAMWVPQSQLGELIFEAQRCPPSKSNISPEN